MTDRAVRPLRSPRIGRCFLHLLKVVMNRVQLWVGREVASSGLLHYYTPR